MDNAQVRLRQRACLEIVRNQQTNLVETVGRLVQIMESMPEGDARAGLLEEISCLDVIEKIKKKALDSFPA